MTGMAAHLTRRQQQALGLAVAVVLAGMAMGFLSSFTTLDAAAQAHHWRFPWLLPASVDSGILAYVVLDLILGARSRWLHLAAWGLAAFTVWANAAVGSNEGSVWRVIHAAMPALWVLGVEALRFIWKRLHDAGTGAPDVIPRGRWLAAPIPALALWRRMHVAYHCGYARAAILEDARLHAADTIRAHRERDPGLSVPASLRRAVRQGRLPADVVAAVDAGMMFGGATRWAPQVESWVSHELTLPERAAAALDSARQDIARQAAPPPAEAPSADAAQQAPAPPARKAPAAASRKASASAVRTAQRKGRKATDDDIRDAIRELFADGKPVTKYRVMDQLPVGDGRAGRLLAEVQAERPPLAAVQ